MSTRSDLPNRDDWDQLILNFTEDRLSADAVEQVARLLDDHEFQLRFANFALDQAELLEAARPAFADGRLAPKRNSCAPTGLRSPRYRWVGAAAAALLFLAAATLLYDPASDPFESTAELPRLKRAIGEVMIDGKPAVAGAPIRAGQRVQARTPMSFAALHFTDGTEIRLAGEATVTCHEGDAGRAVRILAGNVSASVKPQPTESPMVIQTSTAAMEVLGTDLAVSAAIDHTRLNVASGAVRMRHLAGHDSIVVKRGEFAVASPENRLQPRPALLAPDEWLVDFTDGTRSGWQGRPVKRDGVFHNGSLGAVQSEAGGPHGIASVHAWSEGLFRIHYDSWLNYRIKLAKPKWYQVILCVRDDHYRAPNGQPLHEFQELIEFADVTPGEWRIVSAPLSAFRLPQKSTEGYRERPNHPPAAGSTAFLLLFATLEGDLGLEIDRIWISRGGPQGSSAEIKEPTI
jgi:ferric-dicitrate binding protein FerR (iron transport regulator)